MTRFRKYGIVACATIVLACDIVGPTPPPPPPPPPPATRLAFTVQPTSATAAVPLTPAVVVAIQDSLGSVVRTATDLVTITLVGGAGGAVLTGTTSLHADSGLARFATLSIKPGGSGYTLTASAPGLTDAVSAPFDVAPTPQQLVFSVQPTNVIAGSAIAPSVQVVAQDSLGDTATTFNGIITVAVGANPGAGTMSGTASVGAVHGVATFSTLSINKVGTGYTLTAAAPSISGATSDPFDVAAGPASRLIFTGQPSNVNVGATMAPAIQVTAQDASGNTATGFNGAVTLAFATNPGGATLSGTTAEAAVNGVATFSDLSITKPASGYILRASSGTVASATSVSFTILPVSTSLHITTATTGAALPSGGYFWCVDPYSYSSYGYGCGASGSIDANGAATLLVTDNSHIVRLDNIARNCALVGDTANPRFVTASGLTEVPFSIACLDTGTVRLTVTTTGADPDQNGYYACVSKGLASCFWFFHVLANDAALIPGVTAEAHNVTLSDVVGNCTVNSGTGQTVTVPAHGSVDARFTVGCSLAERLALSASGTITVVRLDGVSSSPITHGFAPAWTADGARLAYECGADICAINPDGSGFAQLTNDAASNRHPTWSSDGTKLAFAATHSGVSELWVMDASGSGAVQLTHNVGFIGSPAWSPDGTTIVFDCQVDAANTDICAVNADGTGFVRLTNDPASDRSAAWKRDGSALAFVTNRYGADEIAVMNSSGAGVTRIGTGLRGFEPTWSPDGSQLAFVRLDQYGQSRVYTVRADGSNVVLFWSFSDAPAWKPHP